MIILTLTFISGVIAGILLYRNNIKRMQATEDKSKSLLDYLKGRKNID